MKPVDKSNRDAAQARHPYKTKNDFLRWLREQGARHKQVTQTELTQADYSISRALMVWADDGGSTA